MSSTKYEVVKFVNNDFEIDVNVSPNEETVWLTQKQMSVLFNVSTDNIGLHIKNILNEGELDNSVAEESSVTASDRKVYKTKIYNLDMIISVGYRVKSKNGILFRKWANKILKEYMLKGYVVNENRVVISSENYIALTNKVANIDNRVLQLENSQNRNINKDNSILFNDQFYDAYTLLEQIFEKANIEIILMDNYIDRSILDRLTSKKPNVKVIIYTSFNKSRITQTDINVFNIQYPTVTLIETLNLHDRYIVVDGVKLYHVGASIKDAGKKIFSINELDSSLISILLSKL
jgi:hypothetical protein